MMVDLFNRDVTPDEERAIAAFMTRLSALPVPGTSTPGNLTAVWWKAQLLRRWDDQRQAVRPLDVVEPVRVIASLAAAALIFLWALPSLTSAVSQVLASVRLVG